MDTLTFKMCKVVLVVCTVSHPWYFISDHHRLIRFLSRVTKLLPFEFCFQFNWKNIILSIEKWLSCVFQMRKLSITCSFRDLLTTFKATKYLAIAGLLGRYDKKKLTLVDLFFSLNYTVNGAVKEGISSVSVIYSEVDPKQGLCYFHRCYLTRQVWHYDGVYEAQWPLRRWR